jgi:hypothetical protein
MPLIEEISSTENSEIESEEPEEVGGEKSEAKKDQIVITEASAAEAEGRGEAFVSLSLHS